MKGEKAHLSPVSEGGDEDDEDGLYMYDIRDAGVPAVSLKKEVNYIFYIWGKTELHFRPIIF